MSMYTCYFDGSNIERPVDLMNKIKDAFGDPWYIGTKKTVKAGSNEATDVYYLGYPSRYGDWDFAILFWDSESHSGINHWIDDSIEYSVSNPTIDMTYGWVNTNNRCSNFYEISENHNGSHYSYVMMNNGGGYVYSNGREVFNNAWISDFLLVREEGDDLRSRRLSIEMLEGSTFYVNKYDMTPISDSSEEYSFAAGWNIPNYEQYEIDPTQLCLSGGPDNITPKFFVYNNLITKSTKLFLLGWLRDNEYASTSFEVLSDNGHMCNVDEFAPSDMQIGWSSRGDIDSTFKIPGTDLYVENGVFVKEGVE